MSIDDDSIERAAREEHVLSKSAGKIPWGALLLTHLPPFPCFPKISHRVMVLVLTFLCYMNYHMTRKAFSAVKPVLAANCSFYDNSTSVDLALGDYTDAAPGWEPFVGPHCKTLLGSVDYSWLFTYAIFKFVSGMIGDRVNLRYFIIVGMIGSGIGTCLLGVAYFANIHHISYFILIQIFNGMIQSSGWPGVAAVLGNWFGKQGRGLLFGFWNTNISIGNIIGTLIAAQWASPDEPWGWSFMVLGFIMIGTGAIIFFFLVVDPTDVGLDPPIHHKKVIQVTSPFIQEPSTSVTSDEGQEIKDDIKESSLSNGKSVVFKGNEIQSRNTSVFKYIVNSRLYKIVVGRKEEGAIGLLQAFMIPGVIEFSLSFFFAKLVSYTFLFWLPFYIHYQPIDGKILSDQLSNYLSTLFDVGGIIGGIFAGGVSDVSDGSAITYTVMLYLSVPILYLYRAYGHLSLASTIVLLVISGIFVNGPYSLISAVSSDLGTHKSLKDSQNAKATVAAIIDGIGSIGAAFGPLLVGWISDNYGWDNVFYLLMMACFFSALLLTRLVINEGFRLFKRITSSHQSDNKVM